MWTVTSTRIIQHLAKSASYQPICQSVNISQSDQSYDLSAVQKKQTSITQCFAMPRAKDNPSEKPSLRTLRSRVLRRGK